jgi:RNA polymerase sigma-70 factor (ECF subfamily)
MTTPAPNSAPGSDQELLRRLRERDQAAFAEMLDAWSPGLLRVARAYVASAESAADVVQDTWLAVIEGIDRFEGRSSLKTWVYRILTNTAKRRGARESRSAPWSSLPGDGDTGPAVTPEWFQAAGEEYPGHWREFPSPWPTSVVPSPEGRALAAEIITQLDGALAELPGRQRVVITLRDVEGLTSEEVCEVLDISPTNQRVLLHRARSFVRARLETYFAGDPPGPDL